jgi:hypothetical protein
MQPTRRGLNQINLVSRFEEKNERILIHRLCSVVDFYPFIRRIVVNVNGSLLYLALSS